MLEKPTTNYHFNADATNLETDNKGINLYNTSKYFSYIYADRNITPCTIQGYFLATFPNVTQYIYAQPEKQAKELCNMAPAANPIFREIKQIATEAETMDGVLSNLEDVVVVGPIIRVAIEHINISITHMTHRWNSMAHLEVYAEVLIIPPSTVTRENLI